MPLLLMRFKSKILERDVNGLEIVNEWPEVPAGVKFDSSNVELLEHLAAKIGVGNSKPHVFIDDFIPTLEGDEGICYAHPENFPGR
ncbi:NAC domain-containing protein 10-like [Olea europaea var. sylvestris]|uniref:NAC domain-containing protein 10-like n=1 Tax=Olea europaea var. sylvestris TaxID=158386 RepID=UPI000C1D282F|nr:NAC domain-containing protein 10-like [Olea europaea var. sylvestris]XP_022850539.1 NAC domain-containing protein 10-like [Olea europaea var. sylvestris]XP_022850540.1 NAC domain-containing protein 10-like [Olea europaea var. sylvestris]XP_022850541.1 NAC domain-containing protein 10-like [Olea europaea var. sylvestris]XP_022850542.1 NAC domain-containing protein 10-like [Olea europaea var. sylvestris]